MPKRGASGGGSIRKRPDGRWEGRYTVGRNPGTGKQVRHSIYGGSQKEVREKLNKLTGDVDSGSYTEPNKLTVSGWFDVWLEVYVKSSVKPHTYASYSTISRVHIKPNIGSVNLQKLNSTSIQLLYNKLGETKSPKTVRNIHGVLHEALNKAHKLGYIKRNPSEDCELQSVVKKEIVPLDESQIAAFIVAVKGHRYEAVYLVDLFSGMRQGEILGLPWSAVDFVNGTIAVKQQLQKEKKKGGKYYIASVKNDELRVIVPAPYVMQLLREHKRKQCEFQLKAGQLWSNKDNLVFTNEIGEHLSHLTVWRDFKKIVKSIGTPSARFHDLRHSYAVAALASGVDVKSVQESLGHHDAGFTLNTYAHSTEKMKRDGAAKMQEFIESVKKQG